MLCYYCADLWKEYNAHIKNKQSQKLTTYIIKLLLVQLVCLNSSMSFKSITLDPILAKWLDGTCKIPKIIISTCSRYPTMQWLLMDLQYTSMLYKFAWRYYYKQTKNNRIQGRIQNFAKGGSWLMAMVYIVHSIMSMQSMLMLGGSGGMPPRKIWKIRHSNIEFGGLKV